ncbi:MAG: sugar ABC transporter permease [Candidatus Bathyarchaeia archaeon]
MLISKKNSFFAKLKAEYKWEEVKIAFLFLLPSLVLIFGMIIYPVLYSLNLSLYNLDLRRPGNTQFVGLANYIEILQRDYFYNSWRITLQFTAGTVSLGLLLGLGISILLNEDVVGKRFFRSIVLLPWAIPPVVSGLMFKWIFHADFGALNGILKQLGLIQSRVSWLGNPNLALSVVTITDVWITTPFIVLILFPFLQSIPQDLINAAKVDGCNSFQLFRHITLPLIKPGILVVLVLRTMSALMTFDIVYVLTGGGPAGATRVVAYFTWLEAFWAMKLGSAAAFSYIISIVVMIFAAVYIKFLYKRVEY